jgi:hypothetical protein
MTRKTHKVQPITGSVLGLILLGSLVACTHPDVQLVVRSFVPTQYCGFGSCFEVVIQNVGTARGSGRCEFHYSIAPSGVRQDAILTVTVNDLGPGQVFRSKYGLDSDAIRGNESTCKPGVRSP